MRWGTQAGAPKTGTDGSVLRQSAGSRRRQREDVLTVEFTVMGIPCLGLNGGPPLRHDETLSFQVATDDQAETDRL